MTSGVRGKIRMWISWRRGNVFLRFLFLFLLLVLLKLALKQEQLQEPNRTEVTESQDQKPVDSGQENYGPETRRNRKLRKMSSSSLETNAEDNDQNAEDDDQSVEDIDENDEDKLLPMDVVVSSETHGTNSTNHSGMSDLEHSKWSLRNPRPQFDHFRIEPTLDEILAFCRARHPNPDSVDETQLVIDVYLAERLKGQRADEIARNLFKVNLPHTRFAEAHPHSYPFIAGDTFRSFADFAIDTKEDIITWKRLNIDKYLLEGSIIFIKSNFLSLFTRYLLPQITHKFILISHNSDYAVPDYIKISRSENILESEHLLRWFAKNPSREHPKLEALPIGIKSRRFLRHVWDMMEKMEIELRKGVPPPYEPGLAENNASDKSRKTTVERRHLVYINFKAGTNKDLRPQAQKAFQNMSYSAYNLKIQRYFQDLKRSKFVLSPPGSGEDCYRTWEAVIFNAIPIVRNSTLWPLFEDTPTYVLKNWTHVNEEQFLDFRVRSKSRKMVLAQYWFDRINSFRSNL